MSYTSAGDSAVAVDALSQTAIQIQQCRKNLHLSVSEVKTSIHSCFSRLLEMVRSREVFLLNQVDIVQRLLEDEIRTQEISTSYRAVNSCTASHRPALSNSSSMTSSLIAEPDIMDHLQSLQTYVSAMSFEADLSAVRQAICQFGKVNSFSFPSAGPLDMHQPQPAQMSTSFNDNAFNENIKYRMAASTLYEDPQTEDLSHGRDVDHDDDFVVIAEDDNISLVAGSAEDEGVGARHSLDVDKTNEQPMTHVSSSLIEDNCYKRLVIMREDEVSAVNTDDDDDDDQKADSHFDVNTTLSSDNNEHDLHPCQGLSTEHDPVDEPDKPFISEYFARISALPIEHWLIS